MTERPIGEGASRWSPLIPPSRASLAVRARDVLLTLTAWLVLIWYTFKAIRVPLMRFYPEQAARVGAWFRDHFGPVLGRAVMPPEKLFWEDFHGFARIAAALALWLVLWGWWHRERLRRIPLSADARDAPPQPTPLPPGVVFEDAGLPEPHDVWQSPCLHVAFDTRGGVSGVREAKNPVQGGCQLPHGRRT